AAYLDLHKVLLDRAKRASYELLHLAPGHHVLDVGCGPATDTISLGRLVGPGGEVVGVDYDVEMVDEANRRAAAAGVGTWVKHRQADAAGLPFEANVFDAARSERVFQHRLEPQALAAGAFTRDELARLHTSFEEADRAGYFFASVSGVTVAGRNSAQV